MEKLFVDIHDQAIWWNASSLFPNRESSLILGVEEQTSNSHDLNVVTNVGNIKKTLMSTTITKAYQILVEENSNWSVHSNVIDPQGLLLLVVLAVHSVVDHQLTKSQICKIRRWLTSTISQLAEGFHCKIPNFWSKTDRGLTLVAKLV